MVLLAPRVSRTVGVALAAAACLAPASTSEAGGEDVARRFGPSVVTVCVRAGEQPCVEVGLGFVVAERKSRAYLVTAREPVVGKGGPTPLVFATFPNTGNARVAAPVLLESPTWKATALNVSQADALEPLVRLRIAKVKRGAEVWAWESLGRGPKRLRVEGFNDAGFITLDGTVGPAGVGGPVTDGDGLVGMVVSTSEEQTLAVPIEQIRRWFQDELRVFDHGLVPQRFPAGLRLGRRRLSFGTLGFGLAAGWTAAWHASEDTVVRNHLRAYEGARTTEAALSWRAATDRAMERRRSAKTLLIVSSAAFVTFLSIDLFRGPEGQTGRAQLRAEPSLAPDGVGLTLRLSLPARRSAGAP